MIKLFKTRKLAEDYIRENYPENLTEKSVVTNNGNNIDEIDMPDLLWSGEASAISVLDDDGQIVELVAYFEEGDCRYELFIGGERMGTYDNLYDAREAKKWAVEDEEWKDEGAARPVTLFCNGEDITE